MIPVDNIEPWAAAPIIVILWAVVFYKWKISPWRQNKKENEE